MFLKLALNNFHVLPIDICLLGLHYLCLNPDGIIFTLVFLIEKKRKKSEMFLMKICL